MTFTLESAVHLARALSMTSPGNIYWTAIEGPGFVVIACTVMRDYDGTIWRCEHVVGRLAVGMKDTSATGVIDHCRDIAARARKVIRGIDQPGFSEI
jgi:hypothetical protein